MQNLELLNELLKKCNRNCDRKFSTVNGLGTKLIGKIYLGEYDNLTFYLSTRFITILFIPIIPISYYLCFKKQEEPDEFIHGSLSLKTLKNSGIYINKLLTTFYIKGIIHSIITILTIGIALYTVAYIYLGIMTILNK